MYWGPVRACCGSVEDSDDPKSYLGRSVARGVYAAGERGRALQILCFIIGFGADIG